MKKTETKNEEIAYLRGRIIELENMLFSKHELNELFENRTSPFVLITHDLNVLNAYQKMINK